MVVRQGKCGEDGFSLVELLAVVVILAVLAAIAVPIFMQERNAAAARACKAHLKIIADAQAAYATRYGVYCFDVTTGNSKAKGKKAKAVTGVAYAVLESYVAPTTAGGTPTGGLVGACEGFSDGVVCPLDGSIYTCRPNSSDSSAVDIKCPNSASHASVLGSSSASSWQWTLSAPKDSGP